ncbi:MAG: multiheme c-type cytochrome, partial [Planctomycetota bacterium]
MLLEGLVGAVLAGLALAPLAWSLKKRWGLAPALILWVAAPATILGLSAGREIPLAEHEQAERPVELRDGDYVGSSACESCHPQEHHTWKNSYHRTMTQRISPETILGEFDGREVSFYGVTYRVGQDDKGYWFSTIDEATTPEKHYIVLATGWHHMQVYWYSGPKSDRNLMQVPICYLREDRRWVPVDSTFLRPKDESSTYRDGLWNQSCSQCHTTASEPHLGTDGSSDTTVAEFGI